MNFWLAAVASCVLAIGIVLWPLLKKKVEKKNLRSSILLTIAIGILLPLSTGILYWHWGAYQAQSQAALVQARMADLKQEISQSGSRQSLISQFEAHLKQNPDNPKGWYLLAKLYLHDGRYPEAVKALRQSKALNADDPETLLSLAQALYLVDHNRLSPEAQTLLLQVIKKAPESPIPLTLLGMDEYNKGHFRQALTYFEQLLPFIPSETEDGKRLLEIIAQAQKHIQ